MPVQKCTINGRSGYKWGKTGKCYTYDPGSKQSRDKAKKKAALQGRAIIAGGYKEDQEEPQIVQRLKAMGYNQKQIDRRLSRNVKERQPSQKPEREYRRFLSGLVSKWRDIFKRLVEPKLYAIAQQAYMLKPDKAVDKKDAWPEELQQILTNYNNQVTATLGNIDFKVQKIGFDVSDLNLSQWKRTTGNIIGLNLFTREPWLLDQLQGFTNQNVQLIKKLSQETTGDIERIIYDGFQSGRRVENISKEILSTKLPSGRFRKTKHRANLIARDQTAKLNGQLSELRQNELGIDKYTWNTVSDEKVRTSHSVMNGKLCRWDDAAVYSDDGGKTWKQRSSIGGVEKHPGQDYQCRCFPTAYLRDLLNE